MRWNTVQSNWSAFIAPLMQRFPATEEEDLLDLEGDRDGVLAYIAEREGLSRGDAEQQLAEWVQGEVPADVAMDESRDNENVIASGAHIGVGEDVYSDDRAFGDREGNPEPPVGRTS